MSPRTKKIVIVGGLAAVGLIIFLRMRARGPRSVTAPTQASLTPEQRSNLVLAPQANVTAYKGGVPVAGWR